MTWWKNKYPEFFVIGTGSGLVYRKEQFEYDGKLSMEYIIRDRLYFESGICSILEEQGFEVVLSRPVRAGKWDVPRAEGEGKEILVIVRKKG